MAKVIMNRPTETVTASSLRTNYKQCFVFDDEKDRIYIVARPKAGWYLVNLETGDVKWKPVATFAELVDKCVAKGVHMFTYDTVSELMDLVGQYQDGDLDVD